MCPWNKFCDIAILLMTCWMFTFHKNFWLLPYNIFEERAWAHPVSLPHVVMCLACFFPSKAHTWETTLCTYCKKDWSLKVHLTPKYFFSQINLCTCLKCNAPFCPSFNPNLHFLQSVKVTKSGHYLLHDRASKGYGSIPGWTSQTDLNRIKSL